MNMKHFLIFRCDRIGDVINTLPMAEQLKRLHPGCHVTFISSRYGAGVLELSPDLDQWGYLQDGWVVCGGKSASLAEFLRQRVFDTIFCVHVDARTAFQVWWCTHRSKIVGPRSKWYTWLFYTHGVRQHRSQSQKHECAYNQDLVGVDRYLSPRLKRPSVLQPTRRAILWHPFGGNSCLYLTPKSIVAMFQRTEAPYPQIPFIFCGSEAERDRLYHLVENINAIGKWDVLARVLPSLQAYAELMVSNLMWVGSSTGPMHLAAALRIPVMTYFSPVRVHHPRRWGPFGKAGAGSSVWKPVVNCPAAKNCLGSTCSYYVGAQDIHEACLHRLVNGDFLSCVLRSAVILTIRGGAEGVIIAKPVHGAHLA